MTQCFSSVVVVVQHGHMVGVCVLTEALVELVEEVLRPAEAGGGDVMWRGVEGGSRGAWETPISLSE